ncbi:putative phage terminase, small subunit, P27 family [Mesomycoplasma conjunctivae]|uniref:Uncharacterized protein n=1 Tax=Mesomycoplasma conjunctivae (strain ATCC 25834 / NCTC 10147 / HRC/581) TaxID=572263 RepID=C5J6T7_MESCH|nr:hypothetical protein [Mesomycoplasma conjunctivae]CAT05200.1 HYPOTHETICAL PROTEIN MCJ_004950 [Mesomycoplasma conjunctivae]VEU66206.1 putative phage terminase, small subunit, P27 family [Mesomycoplasma conjunctivae]VEU66411.1 putative phage terminase, small subunit, P27 family [Mesomycoplasma conjunctivae]
MSLKKQEKIDLFKQFKNKKEIQKILKNIEEENANKPFKADDFIIFLFSMDDLIQKIKAQELIFKQWTQKIKPNKIKQLKKDIDFYNAHIKRLEQSIDKNKQLMENIYSKNKKGDAIKTPELNAFNTMIDRDYKSLVKTREDYNRAKKELLEISATNLVYSIDDKGILKKQDIDLNQHYNQIINMLAQLGLTPLSRQKLKESIIEEQEEDLSAYE